MLQQLPDPSRLLAAIVSFEGPDPSSQAGGLGVRVTGLSHALAELGIETHVFFMGDPALPGEERVGRHLVLHRWGQWISTWHPAGVYDGEEGKRNDLAASLPAHLTETILRPAIRVGRTPIVLSEEWQTAECATRISECLDAAGVRDRALLAWNANNAYSFDRIDWPRLAISNTITTVSRFMRSIIRARGFDAHVIPNGIPLRLTRLRKRTREIDDVRAALAGVPFFFKMARWEREKGWIQALDALRILRDRGSRAVLLARAGGPMGSANGLSSEAQARDLEALDVYEEQQLGAASQAAVTAGAAVVNLRFGVSESRARALFAAADGVLANSVHEPFGLVGLEAMAAGGVIYTGGTGEDYAISGQNAVVLGTLDPDEIADRAEELALSPRRAERIRRAARQTARQYTWPDISQRLLATLEQRTRKYAS